MVLTITGSTGTIGTELVRVLSGRDVPVRAVLRDFSKAQQLPNVAWVQADLGETDKLDAVLAGTDRLFVLTGNAPGFGRIQTGLIEAAARLGVRHVVKLSALGASGHSRAPLAREHWEVEQALQQKDMSWTILRPHSFMQNWLGDVARSVREEHTIYAAIGDGRVPFIDARDIADVAAETLLDPDRHAGRKYVLTGDTAVGYADLARALSDTLGEPVRYHAMSMDEARTRMEAQGMAPASIESMLALAAYQKAGGPTERTSEDVARILARPARTVDDFARDYRQHFRKDS